METADKETAPKLPTFDYKSRHTFPVHSQYSWQTDKICIKKAAYFQRIYCFHS